jgi:outer membrane protein assembly factor BamB
MRRQTLRFVRSAVWALSLLGLPTTPALAEDPSDYPWHEWPTFGGDYAQTRFSQLNQINRDNVHHLEVKWTFSTGLSPILFNFFSPVPIVVGRVMYFSDPGNFGDNTQRVFAVDAKTGAEIWRREIALGDVAEQRGWSMSAARVASRLVVARSMFRRQTRSSGRWMLGRDSLLTVSATGSVPASGASEWPTVSRGTISLFRRSSYPSGWSRRVARPRDTTCFSSASLELKTSRAVS